MGTNLSNIHEISREDSKIFLTAQSNQSMTCSLEIKNPAITDENE